MWEIASVRRTVTALILLVVVLAFRAVVAAGAPAPACTPAVPQPPIVVRLPGGEEIAAARLQWDVDARALIVTGHAGIFCSGFEGPSDDR